MTIFNNSRYRFGDVQSVQDSSREFNEVHRLRRTAIDPPIGSISYVVKAGDTFESLAYKFYDDADRWYVLADANPDVFWPLDLIPGRRISIPPVSILTLI
jgi:nucleoid-associated protein YgaU